MSFIEVLIAVAMIGLLVLATGSVTQFLSKSTEYGERTNSILALSNLIRENIKYTNLCDMAIGPASTYNQNTFDPATGDIRIAIPNIQSGPNMNMNYVGRGIVVLPMRVQVDRLRLKDLTNTSGNLYLAQVYLTASEIGGIQHKEVPVASVYLNIDGVAPNMSIQECYGTESGISRSVCENMGCAWNTANNPACQCVTPNGICPLGEVPIAVKNGIPDCRPLGGAPCPPGEYLVGVSVGTTICAPIN